MRKIVLMSSVSLDGFFEGPIGTARSCLSSRSSTDSTFSSSGGGSSPTTSPSTRHCASGKFRRRPVTP